MSTQRTRIYKPSHALPTLSLAMKLSSPRHPGNVVSGNGSAVSVLWTTGLHRRLLSEARVIKNSTPPWTEFKGDVLKAASQAMAQSIQRAIVKAALLARGWLGRSAPPIGELDSNSPQVDIPQREFVPPGHFYSPIPDLADVSRRGAKLFDTSITSIAGVELNEAAQLALLEDLHTFYAEQPFKPGPTPERRYHFDNPMYSYSDAVFLYCMLRRLRPARVIEVGSGYSSAVTLDTNELFLGGNVQCTFIEPHPETLRSILRPSDIASTEILPVSLQEVELSRFRDLRANDVLLVDSTHVSKIGSDVNRLFFEILPLLAPGVHVHFHDIFFPFEYPRAWVEEGRAWNEMYLLRAFLQYNAAFEIVLFNTFLEIRHPTRVGRLFPLCMKNLGGSIWLRRKALPNQSG